MRSVNKVILLGNVTRDPDLRYTSDGRAVCSLGIATNRVWKDSNGEQQSVAEFTNLVVWAKAAELIAQYVKTGDRLYVEGRLQTKKWEDKNGIIRYTTEVVVNDFVLLSPKTREENLVDQAERIMKSDVKQVEPVETISPKENEDVVNVDEIPF